MRDFRGALHPRASRDRKRFLHVPVALCRAAAWLMKISMVKLLSRRVHRRHRQDANLESERSHARHRLTGRSAVREGLHLCFPTESSLGGSIVHYDQGVQMMKYALRGQSRSRALFLAACSAVTGAPAKVGRHGRTSPDAAAMKAMGQKVTGPSSGRAPASATTIFSR